MVVMLKGSVSVSVCGGGGDGDGMGALARSQSQLADGESRGERWEAGGETERRRGCGW